MSTLEITDETCTSYISTVCDQIKNENEIELIININPYSYEEHINMFHEKFANLLTTVKEYVKNISILKIKGPTMNSDVETNSTIHDFTINFKDKSLIYCEMNEYEFNEGGNILRDKIINFIFTLINPYEIEKLYVLLPWMARGTLTNPLNYGNHENHLIDVFEPIVKCYNICPLKLYMVNTSNHNTIEFGTINDMLNTSIRQIEFSYLELDDFSNITYEEVIEFFNNKYNIPKKVQKIDDSCFPPKELDYFFATY